MRSPELTKGTVAGGTAPAIAAALLVSLGVIMADAYAAPPSTARSRAAVARVKPDLLKALTAKGLEWGSPVFMRIFKEEATLEVWVKGDSQYVLLRSYDICYFSGKLGPKLKVGDCQSPEGFYAVGPRQMNPASQFHLSFNLGYPNRYDRAHKRTGSALMVHGNCVSIGCYAMTDSKIEEIYALADAALRNGQSFFRVHVFPFRMSAQRLEQARNSKWHGFWENLKEGYDWFERSHLPPNVVVRNKAYAFHHD